MIGIVKISVWSLSAVGALTSPSMAQNTGNMWDPYAPQQGQMVQPKYVGDAPVAIPPAVQQPRQPSRFAPAGLEQQLDARPYSVDDHAAVQTPQQMPSMQMQPQQLPLQNFGIPQQPWPGYGTNGPVPGYGPAPQAFGYSGVPQQFGGYPQGFGPYPPQGFNGFQQGYGGYPQGYGGYPQAYGPPTGYGNPGYPGGGFFGQPSPFGFPGNFGSFPGTSSNGGMPGFGFSPFGFF